MKGKRAKELLAQMNINEDLQDEAMLTENPQWLSAAIHKCGRQYIEDDEDGELFDFTAVKQESYSNDMGPDRTCEGEGSESVTTSLCCYSLTNCNIPR